MKRLARARMVAEREGHTPDTLGLVNEAWLRLEATAPKAWRDRKQFYAAASEAMRRILVEAARRRLAAKRGGGKAAIPEDQVVLFAPLPDDRLVAVHEALDQLEQEDATNAAIVKLRFFAGMNNDEIAALLEVNAKTIRRRWAIAKSRGRRSPSFAESTTSMSARASSYSARSARRSATRTRSASSTAT